jgi:hypothetical protein
MSHALHVFNGLLEDYFFVFVILAIAGSFAYQGYLKVRNLVLGVKDDDEEEDSKSKSKTSGKKRARSKEGTQAGDNVDALMERRASLSSVDSLAHGEIVDPNVMGSLQADELTILPDDEETHQASTADLVLSPDSFESDYVDRVA